MYNCVESEDEATAAQIVSAIRETYFEEFEALKIKLDELKQKEQARNTALQMPRSKKSARF